jgi:solute carrier family 24 (sodium/potassium/calcium exchanger), member 6
VEGYYNRGIIAISFALSPLWFAFYLWYGKDINLFRGEACFFFVLSWVVTILLSVLVLRFAPGGEGNMNLVVAAPLALYGFAIAATWIDFIADRLVSLLDFMGIVLHIPSSIMGLTVLAWGNSMGDLSANITMARKGLANMAMTACFAGPVFNILIGLGLGFSSLAAETGNAKFSVSLTPSVKTGFVFVLLNCVSILVTGFCLGKGRIEIYYGYIALGLYTVYLIISISLQLSD